MPTPEKKPRSERAASHEGECGVCERRFTVTRGAERLALHGFERPGHGWLLGRCPGINRLPVERSVETIEILLKLATARAESLVGSLEQLRSPALTELLYERRRAGSYNLPRSASHAQRYETLSIARGAPADYQRGLPSFDDLLARRIGEVEQQQKQAQGVVARAKARIASWQPSDLRSIDP